MKSDCSILLIEDNKIDQLVTSKLLKKTFGDINISIVSNGQEGIEWLRDYEKDCRTLIILLDIKMPVMDGFEFLMHFDSLSETIKRRTEIFMLSSTLDATDIKKAEANNYVKKLFSKPLPVLQLKEMITI